MVTVSLCMIVKNEEAVLGRCLEHVKSFADEIILVDTGSIDRTKEIGERFGAKIYDFAWRDDFSAARNEAFSKASMDYCMWLDADDVVTEENQARLVKLKEELEPDTDVVMMKYTVSEDAGGNALFSYYRERLIKNRSGFFWEGRVHEAITPRGKVLYSDIAVFHRKAGPGDPDRNLQIYERMMKEGEKLQGRSLFYYGRELMAHRKYEEAVGALEEFLGQMGWPENQMEACLNLNQCFQAMNQKEEGLRALCQSFVYGMPKGEICFEIGRYFQEKEQWALAAFWYETILRLPAPEENGGFIRWDYYGYLPEINLCVCYDRMGKREMAYKYHKKAQARKPEAEEVKWNEQYFQGLKEGGQSWTDQTYTPDI